MERANIAGGHTGEETLDTLRAFGRRFTDMVAGLDPGLPVPDSDWTVGDTVAHVAAGVDAYARYLAGDATPLVDLSDIPGGSIAVSNARWLADHDARDPTALTATIQTRLDDLVDLAGAMGLDDPVPWHGVDVPLRTLLATSTAEIAMHGRDIARAVDRPWPLSRREAVLMVSGVSPLLPALVNPETTQSLEALVLVRVRGGPELPFAFDHGQLTLAADGKHPDATVSADAVAFLLVAYGRESQWPAIATGKLLAWGRRPWLALRLTSYLVRP
jgi:uncharacterized protein (TIGR03083 family)